MDEVNKLIIKAEKNIEVAEKLIEIGYFHVASIMPHFFPASILFDF